MPTDSELLRRYAHESSESAFARLFSLHERLVLGVAYRSTGDMELARDVTQQVFAALAHKARELTGRSSLVGWLYEATRFQAAKTRRRTARFASLIQELPAMSEADDNSPSLSTSVELEEALAALGQKEREALLLHYFEDRSYVEMAGALQLSEAACRKRVSRALQQLGAGLRKRGVVTSAAKLIVGAVAAQSALPAQAITVSAILATPVGNTALGSALFTTLMSHTTLKIAAAVTMLAAIPLTTQLASNHSLRRRISQTENQFTNTAAASSSTPSASASNALAKLAALDEENARTAAEVERARKDREQKHARLRELEAVRDRGSGEMVLAMGAVEDMAREASEFARLIDQFDHIKGGVKEAGEERAKLAKRSVDSMTRLSTILRKVADMERDPARVAHFYATLFGEAAGLELTKAQELEAELTKRFEQLRADGLAFPQRPTTGKEDWELRRYRSMQGLVQEIERRLALSKGQRRLLGALGEGTNALFFGSRTEHVKKPELESLTPR